MLFASCSKPVSVSCFHAQSAQTGIVMACIDQVCANCSQGAVCLVEGSTLNQGSTTIIHGEQSVMMGLIKSMLMWCADRLDTEGMYQT